MLRVTCSIWSLLLCCSCASFRQPAPIKAATELPAAITMNRDAGRGGWLMVTLRLEDGTELPMIVDTGSSWTLLDKSLEPRLGNRRGQGDVSIMGTKHKLARYSTPKFYLGDTPLVTGRTVYTLDFQETSTIAGRRVMGLVGMDCLKHYCLQLDFKAGELRFLDPNAVTGSGLGEALPISFKHLPFLYQSVLMEDRGTNWWLIDSGCDIDAVSSVPLFGTENRPPRSTSGTNTSTDDGGRMMAMFSRRGWSGRNYTNVVVATGSDLDLIGLRFLARHLVTLNFPKRTLYLKQTSIGPLANDNFMRRGRGAIRGATEYLNGLRNQGRLPGLSRDGPEELFCIYHPQGDANDYSFIFQRKGDAFGRHYQVVRMDHDSPWKLHRAWRTDLNHRKIEEYSVP